MMTMRTAEALEMPSVGEITGIDLCALYGDLDLNEWTVRQGRGDSLPPILRGIRHRRMR